MYEDGTMKEIFKRWNVDAFLLQMDDADADEDSSDDDADA
jgi:hypothetical protein